MSEFGFKMTDPLALGELSPLPSVRDAAIKLQAKRLTEETERWCWKAIAKGVGYRVWRSHAEYVEWPNDGIRWRFAILAPGVDAPGNGTIFGPFS